MILFEKNTEKWFRLKEHLYGLDGRTKDLKVAIKSFDLYYPKVRSSSITFSDIILAVSKLKKVDVIIASKAINRNRTVTYEFLHKLEKWGIFQSQRIGLKKYYHLKSNFKIPRR